MVKRHPMFKKGVVECYPLDDVQVLDTHNLRPVGFDLATLADMHNCTTHDSPILG